MTKATTNVARVAAAVAGLGLVAMSFAPLAGAQTSMMTTTSTTPAMTTGSMTTSSMSTGSMMTANSMLTFTRDLTVGSTGTDVTALQTWLMGKGFSIPAGATGYFGAQTKAALAAYQASVAITPAVGYFGPITRAYVNVHGSTTTTTTTSTSTVAGCMPGAAFSSTTGASCSGSTTTTTTSTGTLSGGEADLTDYDLRSGDDLSEGDSNKEIASAKFDVDGGDVNVQRIRLTLEASNATNASQNPWKYFDTLSVYNGNTKVGSVDAGDRSDYDSNGHITGLGVTGTASSYTIDIPVNTVIKDNATADLSIRATAQDTIDSDDEGQTFALAIDDNDLRAVDAAGIQEYTGDLADYVSVGFNSDIGSNDLSVRESSDDPDSGVLVADENDTNDNLSVFKFEIKNDSDNDAILDTLQIEATSTGATLSHIIRRATLTVDGTDYDASIPNANAGLLTFNNINNDDVTLGSNDTTDFELTIDLASAGTNPPSGQSLIFSVDGTNDITAEGEQSGDTVDVGGTANSNKQTIGVNGGINVEGTSNSASTATTGGNNLNNYGTFTLKFDVSANGDDVYVPRSIAATGAGSTTAGVVFDPNLSTMSTGSTTSSITSTADVDTSNSGFYVVHDGDSETFTASVTIDPNTSNYYQVGLDAVRFTTNANGSGLQTLDVDQTDNQFQTTPLYITNP